MKNIYCRNNYGILYINVITPETRILKPLVDCLYTQCQRKSDTVLCRDSQHIITDIIVRNPCLISSSLVLPFGNRSTCN